MKRLWKREIIKKIWREKYKEDKQLKNVCKKKSKGNKTDKLGVPRSFAMLS